MSEDFVRYYIGNISIHTLERVQRDCGKFDDWILKSGSDFKYRESYGYEQVAGSHEEWIEVIRKDSVIAEHKNPKEARRSSLWRNAFILDDVLTLLSLARAEHYPILMVERNYELHRGIWYPVEATSDIVPFSNFGRFISEALTFIEQNPGWLKDSGFAPAIHWYMQALKAYGTGPSILEVALYWVSLEIVASTYLKNRGTRIRGKEQRVRRFIKERCYTGPTWKFLKTPIRDWYEMRNSAFHEGKEPKLSMPVLKTRRQQARDFVSLVFVEMLQLQGDERRTEIATRIQNY